MPLSIFRQMKKKNDQIPHNAFKHFSANEKYSKVLFELKFTLLALKITDEMQTDQDQVYNVFR